MVGPLGMSTATIVIGGACSACSCACLAGAFCLASSAMDYPQWTQRKSNAHPCAFEAPWDSKATHRGRAFACLCADSSSSQQPRASCYVYRHPLNGCAGCCTGADISWRYSSIQQAATTQQQHQQQHSIPQPLSPRQQQLHKQQQTWGSAVSLYDLDPRTGQRNGDPIADCFATIAYQQGAVMALADGVNWGERPKAAARGAVLGFCSSLHQQLAYAQGMIVCVLPGCPQCARQLQQLRLPHVQGAPMGQP
jgi:hypothetical protein